MLSLTFSFCAHTLIFAFCYLLVKHQWRLLWEGMSTGPKRPHWSCQCRVAEILLAVLVQFCSHVQGNEPWSEPACSSCTALLQPWNTWKTTCVHRWLQGNLSTAQRRAVMLRRVILERTWLIVLCSRLAGATTLSTRATWHMSHHWPTSRISLGVTKRLLTPVHPMVGLSLCTTVLLCWWKRSFTYSFPIVWAAMTIINY